MLWRSFWLLHIETIFVRLRETVVQHSIVYILSCLHSFCLNICYLSFKRFYVFNWMEIFICTHFLAEAYIWSFYCFVEGILEEVSGVHLIRTARLSFSRKMAPFESTRVCLIINWISRVRTMAIVDYISAYPSSINSLKWHCRKVWEKYISEIEINLSEENL